MAELKQKRKERKARHRAVMHKAGRMAVVDLLEIALLKAWVLAKEIKDPQHRVTDMDWVPQNPVEAISKIWQWAKEQTDEDTVRLMADMKNHPLAAMSDRDETS